jgi:spermidine synthase
MPLTTAEDSQPMEDSDEPQVLDRVTTPRGELVLRRVGRRLEVISNGVFLMDSRDGRSERALVSEALSFHGSASSVLIGGLGVGSSLREAAAHPTLDRIVVVEIEQRVVDWHGTRLAELTGEAMTDPRVKVVVADVREHLLTAPGRYDVVCMDVDNGPDWTVTDTNAQLYGPAGVGLMRNALAPGGVLAVWSANESPRYQALLQQYLDDVRALRVDVRLARAEPDVVYLGRRR